MEGQCEPNTVAHQGLRRQRALASDGRQHRHWWHGPLTTTAAFLLRPIYLLYFIPVHCIPHILTNVWQSLLCVHMCVQLISSLFVADLSALATTTVFMLCSKCHDSVLHTSETEVK